MRCPTSLLFLFAILVSYCEAVERGIYPRQNPLGAPPSGYFSAQSFTKPTWVISLETGTDLDAFCALVESFPDSSCKHQLTATLHGVIIEADQATVEALMADEALGSKARYAEESVGAFSYDTLSFSGGAGAGTETVPDRWNLDRIDQPTKNGDNTYAWTVSGAGATVYVIDTYVNTNHQDFRTSLTSLNSRITAANPANIPDTAADCSTSTSMDAGHGTHVCGIAGGLMSGVAKGVTIMAVKGLSCSGSGSTDKIMTAMDYVGKYGTPGVVSMSLGAEQRLISLGEAIGALISKGHVVVVAAGNSASDACYFSPAFYPGAITVGASDEHDSIASAFSNFGPCVDIYAPGTNILSAKSDTDTDYVRMDGTSMATPHVAGAIALYLSVNPTSSPTLTRYALLRAAGLNAKAFPSGSPLLYVKPLQSTLIDLSFASQSSVSSGSVRTYIIPESLVFTPSDTAATVTLLVKLTRAPAGPLTIGLALDDEQRGTLDKPSLVFDASTWSTAQSVTLTVSDTAAPSKMGRNFYVDAMGPAGEIRSVEILDRRTYAYAPGATHLNPILVPSLPFQYTGDTSVHGGKGWLPSCVRSPVTNTAPGMWFKYTPTNDTRVNITNCDTLFDSFFALVWTPPGTNSNKTVCNDDWTSATRDTFSCGLNVQSSRLQVDLIAGVDYYLLVGGVSGGEGTFKLVYTFFGDMTNYLKIPVSNTVDPSLVPSLPGSDIIFGGVSKLTAYVVIIVAGSVVLFCIIGVVYRCWWRKRHPPPAPPPLEGPVFASLGLGPPGPPGTYPTDGFGPGEPWTCKVCREVNHPDGPVCRDCGTVREGLNPQLIYGNGNGAPDAPPYATNGAAVASAYAAPPPPGGPAPGYVPPGGPQATYYNPTYNAPPSLNNQPYGYNGAPPPQQPQPSYNGGYGYGFAGGAPPASQQQPPAPYASPARPAPPPPPGAGAYPGAPPVVPAAAVQEMWSCPRCTLNNPSSTYLCSACEYSRWNNNA